jgi:polyisoprenoid-binding protein YceI
MIKILKIIFTTLCISLSFILTAQELRINTENSILNWTGKAAFSSYSLTGTLNTKTGFIKIDNNTITTLKIAIDMKSLNHKNKDLKKHLRSDDFFDVKTFTEAHFQLTKPAKIIENQAVLTGKMTIKGIEKEETITVLFDNKILKFEYKMDRLNYGVTFNSPSIFKKMKDNAIADDFILKGNLIFE